MSLLGQPMDLESRAERIFAKIDAEEAPVETGAAEAQPVETEAPATTESTARVAEDAAPAAGQPSGEGTTTHEPDADPPIAAPSFWSKEDKEAFKALPRGAQEVIHRREQERDAEVRRGQNETAAERRKAEVAERAAQDRLTALAQEQQRAAQALAAAAQYMENSDPVIAAYRSTDLQKLARENPAGYTELDAAYKMRMTALDQTKAEQARLSNESRRTHYEREERALLEKVPEWSVPEVGAQGMKDIRAHLVSAYGFAPAQIESIADHRIVLAARDALEAPKLRAELAALKAEKAEREKAAKQAIQDKKVPVGTSRTLKPGPSSDSSDKSASDRSKAILKQAKGIRNLQDKVGVLAQIL